MKSINAFRLTNNPLEQDFVTAWEEANKDNQLLQYILDRSGNNRGDYCPTEIEQETAMTIIQWLGTLVGQAFLRDVIGGNPPGVELTIRNQRV